MKNVSIIIILLFSIFAISCKHKKPAKKIVDYEKTIEQSIISSSNSINPVIKELNLVVSGNGSYKVLDSLYKKAKKNIVVNTNIITNLPGTAERVPLKGAMLAYLVEAENFLDNGVYPIITYYKTNNDKPISPEISSSIFITMMKMMNISDSLNMEIDTFCDKHNITRGLDEFDINSYDEKVEAARKLINE